ncbi:hypothetical protein SKAU_G00333350 [Synaphobranchus kaupii]|uniref:Uncharacterized protein n=1 Tax=Synaphobranchus kaupii TaxID=118154 RepID=A0A9Q1ELH1_SYNKA|nr:hypothetical protein SKAU_G00333350 [Synaphobranchus kaupii]
MRARVWQSQPSCHAGVGLRIAALRRTPSSVISEEHSAPAGVRQDRVGLGGVGCTAAAEPIRRSAQILGVAGQESADEPGTQKRVGGPQCYRHKPKVECTQSKCYR